MSIARRGCDGSDVYVYEHCDNFIACQWCSLNNGNTKALFTDEEALEHMAEHREKRHCVPDYVFDHFRDRIKNEH